MDTPRHDTTTRDLLPLIVALALPLLICIVLMLTEPGLERSFFYASIKVAAILIALGLGISFVVSRFASRDPAERDRGRPV